eukprot:59614_1
MAYCICGNQLMVTSAMIYGYNKCIYCNNCLREIQYTEIMYHCEDKSNATHQKGYDLCDNCCSKLVLNQINDTKISDKLDTSKLTTLLTMGFDEIAAKNALLAADSNVNLATEYLLSNTKKPIQSKPNRKHSCNGYIDECSYMLSLKHIMQKYCDYQYKHCKNIRQKLNEFHHLLLCHTTDKEFERIYNLFGGHCDLEECSVYSRHYRNAKNIATENLECKDIAAIQLLDTIHCFYSHTFDIGHMLTSKQKKIIQNSASIGKFQIINKILCEKHSRHRSHRGDKSIMCSKFMTSNAMKDNSDNVYSFGVEFKYTKSKCEDNYSINSFMLQDDRKYNESIPNAIYVNKKYGTLKKELTTNPICSLTVKNYNVTYINAQRKFNSSHFKKKLFGSSRRPSFKHLLCIMIRCNFDSFQYEFNKTYRRNDINESDESIAKRHQNFYWLAKYLKQVINLYGYKFIDRKYYHGVSKYVSFDALKGYGTTHGLTIWSPISTTDQFAVAMNFTHHNKGIILEFGSYEVNQCGFGGYYKRRHIAKCLSVNWLSRYPSENESLFVQSIEAISIINIISASIGTEYENILKALQLITDLVSEEPVSNIFDEDIIVLAAAILEHQLSKKLEQYKPYKFDEYAEELIKIYFQNSIKRIFINRIAMFTMYKKYSSITTLCCTSDLLWIDLKKLNIIFPGAIELSVSGITVTTEILDDILINIQQKNCHLEVILFSDLNGLQYVKLYQHQFNALKFDIGRWTLFLKIESKERSKVHYVYER